jgi:hypothetical protein
MKDFPPAMLAGLLVSSTMLGATDVSGRWSGFPVYLTLKQDGNTVTGSAGESEDDQVPFESGSIEDDRVALKWGRWKSIWWFRVTRCPGRSTKAPRR